MCLIEHYNSTDDLMHSHHFGTILACVLEISIEKFQSTRAQFAWKWCEVIFKFTRNIIYTMYICIYFIFPEIVFWRDNKILLFSFKWVLKLVSAPRIDFSDIHCQQRHFILLSFFSRALKYFLSDYPNLKKCILRIFKIYNKKKNVFLIQKYRGWVF